MKPLWSMSDHLQKMKKMSQHLLLHPNLGSLNPGHMKESAHFFTWMRERNYFSSLEVLQIKTFVEKTGKIRDSSVKQKTISDTTHNVMCKILMLMSFYVWCLTKLNTFHHILFRGINFPSLLQQSVCIQINTPISCPQSVKKRILSE